MRPSALFPLLPALALACALPACGRTFRAAAPDAPAPGDAAPPADTPAPPDPGPPADAPAADVLPPNSGAVLCGAPGPSDPAWHHGAVGYEVFVRSFQDSDGDGTGDLAGLRARLPYLNDGDPATGTDLGVDLLWLMPVAESPSYHGYDVTDYRAVEADYGTVADLEALVDDAHDRGIRVVADLVLNHTSKQHPWFLDSRSGPDAARRGWYSWSDAFLDWRQPWNPSSKTWHRYGNAWYYGLFWEGMPDLDWRNPAVQAEMLDVARWWLDRGLDGFRLDAARYLVETGPGAGQADTPETHAALRALRAASEAARPGALLVGEIWEKTEIVAPYLDGKAGPELQMAFDFDFADAVVLGLKDARGSAVRQALCDRLQAFPPGAAAGTFLTNHDQVRVATVAEARGPAALRLGAVALLTAPGTPWIYYGEEIGMPNGAGTGDEAKRLPMQWSPGAGAGFTAGTPWLDPAQDEAARTVEGQSADPASLLSWYRRLIRLRQDHPALRLGSTDVLDVDGTAAKPVVLRRQRDGETLWVVWSFAARDNAVALPPAALGQSLRFTDLLTAREVSRPDASSPLSLGTLPPFGAMVLKGL